MISLDLVKCLNDASMKGHLCLTVPWVVQYLSMMDSQAGMVKEFRSVLIVVIDIYRLVMPINNRREDACLAFLCFTLKCCRLSW